MILLYGWLAASRQTAARQAAQRAASEQLEKVQKQLTDLESRLSDFDSNSPDYARLSAQQVDLQAEEARFQGLIENPDKQDRTVPSLSMLYQDGFLRAITPQGAFKRKVTWLYSDFYATGVRLIVALVLGVIASVVLGLLMGCFDPVDAFFMPPLAFLSKVPATAVLPIFFVLIGINFSMYIAIIIFGMLPSLAQAISSAVRKDVPEELIFKAYTLGASQLELIWNVIWRQVLPRVLDAVRLQIGPAVVLLVAAEWLVSGAGVGYRLKLFFQRTDMTVVFVYVILLGIIGLVVDYFLIWLRRRLCPWFGD
ncbi:MAG TPA: hypothetical protein DDW52_27640 [Planctomycetaceae bacterium]|nr:hypothetical protein [Planctomycetaceae bacterium]